MRTLIITLLMLCGAAAAMADNVWCMVTQSGQIIPMSNVSYLLTDGSTAPVDFTIVLKDGDPIENVGRVEFAKLDPTGIETVRPSEDIPTISSLIGNQLTISATTAGQQVAIYGLAGALKLRTVTAADQTTLYIGNLAPGVYVLKVGSTAIKFMKR